MESGKLQDCVLDQYRVGALIGRGGMGEVYRAHDMTLDRAVALKVLPPDVVADADRLGRFVQEARAASALNHPHLVAIYHIGRAQAAGRDVHYIAMELVEGETVRALIDRRGLDLKRTLDYMAQAADAISAAHSGNIVHRDLKPENLMVADRGYVKVLDFGLAKLSDQTLFSPGVSQATALTVPGSILGTVGYMSPEQAEGRSADYRSDIFSFGCVLYEAVTGARAFSGKSVVDTLHRIIHDEPESIAAHLPSAPAELQRILRKCLAKDPEARYQSMKDVAIDLRNLRYELDSSRSIVIPAAPQRHKSAWIIPALAIVGVLVTLIGSFGWRLPISNVPAGPIRIERLTASGNVIDASISPDGKYLTYVESSGGKQGLWLRQLSGTRPLALVPAAEVGFWGVQFTLDSSSIFYAIKAAGLGGGQLFSIPILGDTPRPILSGIDSTVTFSPDGKQIAYLRENFPERGASSLMVADSNGRNPRPLATERSPSFLAPGFFIAPSWSPDGSRVAAGVRNSETRDAALVTFDAVTGVAHVFPTRYVDVTFTQWLPDGSGILVVVRPQQQLAVAPGGQIWLQPFPDGAPRSVTNDFFDYRNVTVSADGKSLVTIATDVLPTLWMIPLDGKGEIQKIGSVRGDGAAGLAWEPRGTILFTTRVGGVWQIARINRDGSNLQHVTTGEPNAYPQATADGKTIVFSSNRASGRGIWRMNTDGSDPKLVAAVPDLTYLAISPDSRTVFFTSSRDGSSSTWRVPIDGGAIERVIADFDRAAISPDGKRLAGVYRGPEASGSLVLAVADVADGKITQIFTPTGLTSSGGVIKWSPDGTSILFTTAERSNIWRQNLSGGPPAKVTNFPDQTIIRAEISPDGKSIVAARGNTVRDAFLITRFQ